MCIALHCNNDAGRARLLILCTCLVVNETARKKRKRNTPHNLLFIAIPFNDCSFISISVFFF